jgi:hypothetical protein
MDPALPGNVPLAGQVHIDPPPGTVPPNGRPFVLQASPLPGSTDQEEFFYDPLADITQGSFAAAQIFFVKNSHDIVAHPCADIAEFQETCPHVTLCLINILPPTVPPVDMIIFKNWLRRRPRHLKQQRWRPRQPLLKLSQVAYQLLCQSSNQHVVQCILACMVRRILAFLPSF